MPSLGLGLGLEIDAGLSSPAAVANPGNPPSLRLLSWYSWLSHKRAYMRSLCPRERAVTYYFDSVSGSDGAAGTRAAPFQTLTKLAAVLDIDVRCRMKRGCTFVGTADIVIPPGATVDDYGTGNRYVFKQSTDLSASWTLDTGTTYYSTLATDPAWIKFKDAPDDIDRPLSRAASIVACRATSDSFFWNTGDTRLYINIGTNPTGTSFEKIAGTASGSGGVSLGVGSRFKGYRLEGFGMHSQAGVIQSYSVKTNYTTNGVAVTDDFEIYYGGYHLVGAIGLGKLLVENGTLGLCRLGPSDDATNIAVYHGVGGNELVAHNILMHSGNLWENGVTRRATSVLGHTNNGANEVLALAVASQISYRQSAYAPLNAVYFANGVDCGEVMENCRAFNVQEYADFDEDFPFKVSVLASRQFQDRCYWKANCDYQTNESLADAGSGWTSNSYLLGYRSASDGYAELIHATAASTGRSFNNRIQYTGYGTICSRTTDAATFPDIKFHNDIIICKNPDQAEPIDDTAPNISNVAGNIRNCAYFSPDPVGVISNSVSSGDGLGAIGDSNKVMLDEVPALDYVPVEGDGLYNGGEYWLQSDHDYYGNPRGDGHDIGPVSSNHSGTIPSAPSATKLVFYVQPSDVDVGVSITPAVKIHVLNEFNMLVSDSTATVTITHGTGNGDVGGDTENDAVSGVATFSDLTLSKDGTHTLLADSSGLTQAESVEFEATTGWAPGEFIGAFVVCLKEEWYTDTTLSVPSTSNGDVVKGWKDLTPNENHLSREANAPTRAADGLAVGSGKGLDFGNSIAVDVNFTLYFSGKFTTGKNCCIIGGTGGDKSYIGHYTDNVFYVISTNQSTQSITVTMNTTRSGRIRRNSGICYLKLDGAAEIELATNTGASMVFTRIFQSGIVSDETTGFWLTDVVLVDGDVSGTSDESNLNAYLITNGRPGFLTGP